MSEPISYTSRSILAIKSIEDLLVEYTEVLQRLHGDSTEVQIGELQELLNDSKEIVSFVLIDNKIVATAQASFHYRLPHFEAFINNVVTHPDYGGQGLGRLVMDSLEKAVLDEWGMNGSRKINLLLSNSPKKKNSGFYEKLGWTSRGPDSASPTIMWVKTI